MVFSRAKREGEKKDRGERKGKRRRADTRTHISRAEDEPRRGISECKVG